MILPPPDSLQDLAHELHSDFGGNFGRAVDGVMMTPPEFDAYCLRHGIEVCVCVV